MINGFEFSYAILLASGRTRHLRLWRQNVGLVRKADGGMFKAGAPAGAADLTGIVAPSGRRVEIEVKGEGDTPSPAQIRWGKFVTLSGGVYVLASYDKRLTMEQNVNAVMRKIGRFVKT